LSYVVLRTITAKGLEDYRRINRKGRYMLDKMAAAPPAANRNLALGIIAGGTVLAVLYFGRDVLVPIALAVILSLLMAPLVRGLRRIGLGQTVSVIGAVIVLAFGFLASATVIGSQLVRLAANLPTYESRIRAKIETVENLSVRRLRLLHIEAGWARRPPPTADSAAPPPPPAPAGAAAVDERAAPTSSLQVVQRILASVWLPIETTGIVLVVLVFVLLEHESLRDRLIRIAGSTDIRATTNALNDASARLSRFFVSQFAVNFGVGAAIGAGLALLGLPHALLWASLAAVLRFVPYAGVWIAALLSALFAAAVDAGWSLAYLTLGLFVAVELVAGQLLEPRLYGHATGLSPLSVVIAAIFWSWLWGPIGLILSTPLTLCLLVAGRHTQALAFVDILLGDTPALTMPQRLFQRALSGDSDEIIANARVFLRRNSFATYCDRVLMPALHLARLDFSSGTISQEQQLNIRTAVAKVIAVLGAATDRPWRNRATTVLEDLNVGRHLRRQREHLTGKWQGPIEVPPGSIILCVGLGSIADDLATEVLVRILREQKLDARHLALEDLDAAPPPGASVGSVRLIHVVSAYPCDERTHGASVVARLRGRFPEARIVMVFLPGASPSDAATDDAPPGEAAGAVPMANSFEEALQISLGRDRVLE
jgi:predicted PurR-regulated permease PerM